MNDSATNSTDIFQVFDVVENDSTSSSNDSAVATFDPATLSTMTTNATVVIENPTSHAAATLGQSSSSSSTVYLSIRGDSGGLPSSTGNPFTEAVETTSGAATDDAQVYPASANVGLAVGLSIGLFVLLVLIALLVFLLIRRKRKQRKQNIVKMENPTYSKATREAGSVKQFDLTMHTGPMLRSQTNNNSAGDDDNKTNGKRKKEAPGPPIYRPNAGKGAGGKKKSPAPNPPPMELTDLYEKDSNNGSNEALELTSFYTADNRNADPTAAAMEEPLLDTFKAAEKKSPKKKRDSSKVETTTSDDRRSGTVVDPPPTTTTTIERREEKDAEEERGEEEDDEEGVMRTALLRKKNDKKDASNLSIDSYDKTKNPFFAGDA